MAFDHVFADVASREYRTIELIEGDGTTSTFQFRELYCAEPGCDCRQMLFHVHWAEGRSIAASIGFDLRGLRGRGKAWLEPGQPQSPDASALLDVFEKMIAEDAAFLARLNRHHAMWRQAVDAKPARKAPRRRAAGAKELELVVARAAPGDSKVQQRFRTLVRKVDGLKAQVGGWKAERGTISQELARYAALHERQCKVARQLVELLDHACSREVFSKADRKRLAATICEIAVELIEEGGHDDLKAIYNRYSKSDFDRETAVAEAADVGALKAMMETMGLDVGDADVRTVEELRAYAREQQAQEEAAAEARRARRKKSAKQLATETRRADEQRSATKAVQEVYRSLAKALHPDREQDPVERERKAELMREVNIAYEATDLLRLLELQLQLERVDASQVGPMAEEQVRHYIRILTEQSRQLALELGELELPFRVQMRVSPSARLTPADVIAQIRSDCLRIQERLDELEEDVATFADVKQIKAALKMQRRDRAAQADLFS